jgi:hypothetical protein
MGSLVVLILFVSAQFAWRRLVLRPLMLGRASRIGSAISYAVVWGLLPVLAKLVAGAPWSVPVTVGAALVLSVSAGVFVFAFIPRLGGAARNRLG